MTSLLIPTRLRVEGKVNPVIIVSQPRFSWWRTGDGHDRSQRAFQLQVSASAKGLAQGQGEVWDSARVTGAQHVFVPYGGPALAVRQQYFWRVRVWDEQDHVGPWSEPATFEQGLVSPEDWSAGWIEHEVWGRADESRASPLMRRAFQLDAPVRQARLYVSALGLYEARLNGVRVGDGLLAPGWTDYHARVPYQTHDVTGLLREGENVLGAVLGDGWYCGSIGFRGERRHYGPRPRLLAQLEVQLENGERRTISTDSSWKANTGAILASDFLMGETYDAREERPGWDVAGYDDSAWRDAVTVHWHAPLVADEGPPVRALMELAPVSTTVLAPGAVVFDLGQNMVGWARIQVRGASGQILTLRFAEMLNADGTLYTEALRSARATDHYTCRGGEAETYEPHFTFHGFRYVEVSGEAEVLQLTGVVIGSDTPPSGTFACSEDDLNQLQSNIVWGQRGNFLSVPTDCPQRDERLGWLGDAQVFAPTALLNADAGPFFSKWMVDVQDAQSPAGGFSDVAPRVVTEQDGAPGWGNAGVIVPWTMWWYAGDLDVTRRCWSAMIRWMHYLEEANPDGLWLNRRNNDFGDWLAQDGDDPLDTFGSRTPKAVVATAYYANDARRMADLAGALGNRAEQAHYQTLFERIRAAFQQHYLEPDGWIQGRTQTGQTLALQFDLLPANVRPLALSQLVELIASRGYHLTTGFLGVAHLLPALSAGGRADVAHRLLTQDTFPSWLYSVRQGATTIWERWDGYTHERGFQTPEMNSFNHYSLGSVGQWLYEGVVGLQATAPGFQDVLIAPEPGALRWAHASYDSACGHYEVAWQVEDDSFLLQVTVPVGGRAQIRFPLPFRALDAQPVLGSGRHTLTAHRFPAPTLQEGAHV